MKRSQLLSLIGLILTSAVSIFGQSGDDQNPRNLGEQWVKGENFSLYASNKSRNQCTEFIPKLIFVYEVPRTYVFESDDLFQLTKSAFLSKCPAGLLGTGFIEVKVFVGDFRIRSHNEVYSINDSTNDREIPLLKLAVRPNPKDKTEYPIISTELGYGDGLSEDQKPWSISKLEEIIAKRQNDDEADKIRQEKERIAEEKWKAEEPIRRAVALKERISEERASSISVLKLIKPGAPATYDFAGYSDRQTLEKIYRGSFEDFVTRQVLDHAIAEGEDARNNADPRHALQMVAEMSAVQAKLEGLIARYKELASLYFGYHQIYYQRCFKDKESPWVSGSVFKFWMTSNGKVIEGSEKYGYSGAVRSAFKDTHIKAYEILSRERQRSPYISEAIRNDVIKFLDSVGCGSPTSRQFEVNLYLATSFRLSLQTLFDPGQIVPEQKKETTIPSTKKIKTRH